ncbi:hypothetical protein LIER_16588 [Lithospermum erythrorhizon]|uniref:DUF4218 domain-containing protein n=1 Tax=Lithospermum erythrorhizon TaxID=34254 RepID=A0AAV3Q9R8_LITER
MMEALTNLIIKQYKKINSLVDFLTTKMACELPNLESYLGKLKQMVRQKAYVEGSITEAYFLKEVSSYCAMYFEEDVHTNHRQPPRNDDGGEIETDARLSIFRHPGKPTSCIRKLHFMSDKESKTVHLYVLRNTPEVTPLNEMFNAELISLNPDSTNEDRVTYEKEIFFIWMQSYGTCYLDEDKTLEYMGPVLNDIGPLPEGRFEYSDELVEMNEVEEEDVEV